MTDKFRADVLKWALLYIAFGWAIFRLYTVNADGSCTCGDLACTDVGKHPFKGTRGFKDATMDEAQVRSWFDTDAPPFNLAIATGKVSGLTILDIDMGDGKQGAQSWAEVTRDHGSRIPYVRSRAAVGRT